MTVIFITYKQMPVMYKDYSGQNLRGRSFKGQNLEGADFASSDIRSTDFTGANLQRANFRGADIREANLQSANFSRADIRGANFTRANLTGADFSGALAGLQKRTRNAVKLYLNQGVTNMSEKQVKCSHCDSTNLEVYNSTTLKCQDCGAGESVEFAYKLGCSVIQLEGIPEHLTPVLLKCRDGRRQGVS